MDLLLLSISLSLLSPLLAFRFLRLPHRRNLPPTPPFSLPLIGHLHLIKHPIHRKLHKLSQKYGNVLSLRFGSRLVVVVSSSSAVQECFTKNDVALANRPFLKSGKYMAYNSTTLAFSPYGEHWRNLRRICNLEILSTNRLNFFLEIREDQVKHLLHKLCGNSWEEFKQVELESMFLDHAFNIIMRMIAGKKYCGDDSLDEGQSKKFRDMVTQILKYSGSANLGDFIPLWNWIDPTGYENRIMKIGQKSDELLQQLIDKIRIEKDEEHTVIDHLLSLQNDEPQYFSDRTIKGLIQVLLLGGIDTSAVTLEWTLSQLLNNPEVLEKLRVEIDSFIGQDRLVKEADLSSLSYLQGVILETLRLNPPGPLLLPHCTSVDCQIQGYDIPRDTIILVNAWAIHRDPNLWEDATSFKPERHANVNGADPYNLLPFGLGRRACPGEGMAQRVIGLTLSSLIQCFEWERVSSSLVDMSEGEGLTMPKAQPLVAKCRPRPITKDIFKDDIYN